MKNLTADQFAAEFAKSMSRAGYEPSETLQEALREEYASIIELDNEAYEDEGDEYDTVPYFLDALEYAANRISSRRN